MTEFGHIAMHGPGFFADAWGAGPFVINVQGKSYRFEDSDRFGPALVNKRGDPLADPWPAERSPFWRAHAAWVRQGRRLEGDVCIWQPLKPTKVRHMGGRHYRVVEQGDDGGETEIVE